MSRSVRLGGDLLGFKPGLLARFDARLGRVAAVAEVVGVVPRLDDVAVMRQAIEQGRRQFGATKTLAHSANSKLVVMITLVCS